MAAGSSRTWSREEGKMQGAGSRALVLGILSILALGSRSLAHHPAEPEAGYLFPPGGRAGSTVAVQLGIYEWTPDLHYFILNPRVRLEILGAPGKLLLAAPPFFLDQKAYNPLPLPREVPA